LGLNLTNAVLFLTLHRSLEVGGDAYPTEDGKVDRLGERGLCPKVSDGY
jgi:hypothetical protein